MTVLQSSTFEELLKEGVITPDDPLFAKVLTDTNGDILKEGHLFFKKRKSKKDEKKVAHGRSSLPPQPSPPDKEKDKEKEAAAEVGGGGKEEEKQLQKNRKKSGWQKAYVVLYPSHMSVSIYAPPALHMKSSSHIPLKAARCFRPNQENKTPKTNNNSELRKQNIFAVQVFRSGQVPPPSSSSPAQQKRKKEQAIAACLSPAMIVHPHKNKNKKKEDLYYFAPCGNSPMEESEAWMRAIQNRNKKHLFIPDNVVTTVVKCSRPVPGLFSASSSASSSAPSTPLHHNHNKKNNKQATKEQATGYRARGSPLVVGKTAAAVKSPITRKQQPPRPHPRTPQPKQQRQPPKASPMKQGRGGATPTSGAFTPPPAPSRLLPARPSPTTTAVNSVEKQKKMKAVVGGAERGFRTPPPHPRPAPPSLVQQLAAVRSPANVASPTTPPTTSSPMNSNQQHMSGGKGRTRTVKDLNEFWNSPSAATGNSPLILESTLRRLAAPDLSPKKTCKRKISFSQVVHPGEPAYDQNEDDWNEKYQQLVSDLRQVEKEVQEKLGKNNNKGNKGNKGKELQPHEDSATTKQQEIVLKRAVKEKQIALFKFLNKFLDAAKYVSKTIVDEIHLLPSLKTFAPMEGELYSHHGLFVFISGALCECRKDEMDAMKLAAQELKGNMAFQRAAASGLHTALTCIVDYKGFRVVVMAVLPSLSQQTLVYGQLSETQFKDDHPLVREKLEEVGKTIPLMPHTIYYSEGKILKIATSSFITVHQSKEDNRFYVLNLARLFPPDPSLALRSSTASSTSSPSTHKLPVPPLSAPPSSASASSSEARLSLSCFPALSNAAPRSTFSSSFSSSVDIASSQQLAFFRPEFLLSRHHQQTERDEPCFAPLSADAFQEKEIGGFRGALGDEKKVDIIMEYQKHQERIVQASTYLKETVIPAFVAKLCSLEIIPTSSETFTQQLHECGINVRYLPLLAAHPMLSPSVASTLFTSSSSSTLSFASCDPFLHVRQFVVVEMVARTCKHILKQKWRQVIRRSKYESLQSSALASLPSEQHQHPVLMKNEEGKADATKNNRERKARVAIAGVEKELQWTTVKYFNLVLGRGKESQNYWTQTLRLEVKDKFHFDLLLARIGGQGENTTLAMMMPPLNVIRMLFLSMQHHCGVDFEDDPTYPFDTANHNPIPFHKFRKFRAGLSYNTPMPSLPSSSSSNKKDEIEEEDEMETRTHQLALHAAAEGLLNDKAARLLTRLAALHLKRRHSNSTNAEEHALQCGAAALGVVRKVFCAETSNVYRLLMRTFYFKSLREQKQLWREVLLCYENCKLVVEWHLGARSPLLLAAHVCLADLYREDKQYKKAAQYYKEALTLSELIFGELHPLTAPYLQALAQVYQQMDDPALHDQAELYLFKAQQASDTLSSSFAALLAL